MRTACANATPCAFPDPMSACDEADRRGAGHYVTGGHPRNVPGWLLTNDRGEILHDDNTFKTMEIIQ